MTSKLKLIRNNVFSIISAHVLSLILNIITFGLVARILAVEDFGKFNYYLAIIGFSAKLIDLGLNPILLRETTKNNKFDDYLGSVFYLKAALIGLLLILTNIILLFINLSSLELLLLNLFIVNIFFSGKYTNIREILVIPYKIALKMSFPMLLVLLDSVLLIILTFCIPETNSLLYFTVFYVAANIPSTLLILYFLNRKGIRFNFRLDVIKHLIKMSFPIYGYIILMIAFTQFDSILLGILNNEEAVGIYNIAIRLTTPFLVFATAINVTFFPIIVKKIESGESISKVVSLIIKTLIIFSASISLLVIFHAQKIIEIIFGNKYFASIVPLQILSVSIIFVFINFFMVDLLTALNKQKNNFVYGLIINVFSIPFYFLLIPEFSYVAVSYTKLISIIFGTVFLFIVISRFKKININLIRILGWILLSSIFLYLLKDYNLLIVLVPESLLVIVFALLLKVFTYDEMNNIFSMINQQYLFKKISFLFRK